MGGSPPPPPLTCNRKQLPKSANDRRVPSTCVQACGDGQPGTDAGRHLIVCANASKGADCVDDNAMFAYGSPKEPNCGLRELHNLAVELPTNECERTAGTLALDCQSLLISFSKQCRHLPQHLGLAERAGDYGHSAGATVQSFRPTRVAWKLVIQTRHLYNSVTNVLNKKCCGSH